MKNSHTNKISFAILILSLALASIGFVIFSKWRKEAEIKAVFREIEQFRELTKTINDQLQ